VEGVALGGQSLGLERPRSAADETMRRLLRIREAPRRGGRRRDEEAAHRLFSASILLSATRCLLSYVIFPFVIPALGIATAVGPAIGIPVGIVALVFDVRGLRRFFLVEHKWRWWIAVIYAAVMILVASLVIIDTVHLIR